MKTYLYKGSGNGKGREHTQVVETAIGKKLPKSAVIHHVDGNGDNNEPSNLVVCPNKSYHALLHLRQDALAATGNANSRRCSFCAVWGVPTNNPLWAEYTKAGRGVSTAYHKNCNAEASSANRAKKALA